MVEHDKKWFSMIFEIQCYEKDYEKAYKGASN